MGGKLLDALKRYGVAVALAGLALTLRGVLPIPEGTGIYQLPLVAVVLSAWYGGRGPGLLAVLICATGVWYWFVPPVHSWDISPEHALGFAIFVGLCALLSEFSTGRRRVEHALRASEERFRTLVQFSFDVYWESDAQHRFTRQEFSERVADAPAPGSEIGKARWEIPYVEPDEEAWRRHRATLDAHLPFRDFELARLTADGGRRYVSVSGLPAFDQSGRFVGYRGVGRHITDRKHAEAEHRVHVWFLESMDWINRAMQGTNDLDQMMSEVLDAVLEIFASDRAWLLYPCDPDAPSWRAVIERTSPQFPGSAARGRDLPMTPEFAEVARAALKLRGALPAGPGHLRQVKPQSAEHFGVQSEILMALCPKGDRPYLFGLHQCSQPRAWTKEEQRLFEEIGHRLTDALSSLIAFRGLRENERKLEAAQRIAHVGWWERDYLTGRVSLSDEACRIYGVQPVDLAQWHARRLDLIHPEDRSRVAAAGEAALVSGARYDLEYRVVRADGCVRVLHSQGDVTRDESGEPVRHFGVMQDITELRQAEGELRASEARFRTFVDRATDAFFLMDDELRVVDVNRQACESLGFTREELVGMHPSDFDAALDAASIARLAERANAGETVTFETRHRRKDGTTFPVEIRAGTFRQGGKLINLALARDISDRKRAEESLRQSEAYLNEAQRLSHAGSWALDLASNRYVYTSEEFNRIFGFDAPAGAPPRQTALQVIHPDDLISMKGMQEKSLRDKVDTTSEYRIVRPDGTIRHIHTIRHPVVNAAGEVVKLVGTSIDITERKHAEAKHQQHLCFLESMDRINRAIQSTNDLDEMLGRALDEVFDIFQCDRVVLGRHSGESETASFTRLARRERPGFVLDLNLGVEVAADEGLTAMSAGLKAARGPVQWVLGSIPPRIAQHLERVGVQSVLSMPIEPKTERPDYFYVFTLRQCTYPRVWTPEEERLFLEIGRRLGDATTILSTLRDLRASERNLEASQRLAHVGWWERDYATGRVSLSDEACRIFGVQPLDLPQWHGHWLSLIHPEDRESAAAASDLALRGGPRYDVEYRVVRPDGAVRVVHSQGDVTRDPSGRPIRQFGVMQDITELRLTERELRASEARFRTFVDHARDAFFLLDEKLTTIDVNRQACESLGWSREELIGMHSRHFDAALDQESIARLAERAEAGETITFETRHRRKDGTVFPVEIRAGTFRQGGELFYLALARDISERKRAEEIVRAKDNDLQIVRTELAHVSRLTTLGELTTSIVHEVSQPLGAMVASAAAGARWLAADPPDIAEARSVLDNISADGKRAREVIARIRALTKRQMPRMELLDINRKILDVVALTEHEVRTHDIVLRTELDRTLPPVAGDRVQLQQVLLNLMMNAMEAMSGVHDRARELTIVSGQDGPGGVVVEVRDSGPGLEPERVQRVFEPFYTTKSEGIGIGLSISRSIVEAHGGRLWAGVNEPHGAVFRFSLPIAGEGQS